VKGQDLEAYERDGWLKPEKETEAKTGQLRPKMFIKDWGKGYAGNEGEERS